MEQKGSKRSKSGKKRDKSKAKAEEATNESWDPCNRGSSTARDQMQPGVKYSRGSNAAGVSNADGDQRQTEVGGRRSEIGDRRSEVGGRESKVGSRKSRVGGRRLKVWGRRSKYEHKSQVKRTEKHTRSKKFKDNYEAIRYGDGGRPENEVFSYINILDQKQTRYLNIQIFKSEMPLP